MFDGVVFPRLGRGAETRQTEPRRATESSGIAAGSEPASFEADAGLLHSLGVQSSRSGLSRQRNQSAHKSVQVYADMPATRSEHPALEWYESSENSRPILV